MRPTTYPWGPDGPWHEGDTLGDVGCTDDTPAPAPGGTWIDVRTGERLYRVEGQWWRVGHDGWIRRDPTVAAERKAA